MPNSIYVVTFFHNYIFGYFKGTCSGNATSADPIGSLNIEVASCTDEVVKSNGGKQGT
jgi:hypothetical protein